MGGGGVGAPTATNARDDVEGAHAPPARRTYGDIAASFSLMGWTAFGGPAAHVGLFNKTFVRDASRPWMSQGVFSELLALGQCMPGPTSTQMSFAMGITQRGALGGVLSGGLFQYPGLILMTLGGAGAAEVLVNPGRIFSAFTAGVSVAGAVLVVSAGDSLARSQAKTPTTKALCALSAVVSYYYATAWLFPTLIAFGGCVTVFEAHQREKRAKTLDASASADADADADEVAHLGVKPITGACLIISWLATLIALIVVESNTDYATNKELHWFSTFWRVGSIIFGGGQVVLPLLLSDVVQYETACAARDAVTNACTSYVTAETATSWITEQQFFAGLALAQAMPGPLFNFSAYIGALAARRAGKNVIVGAMCAWFGLFGPGVMLIFAVLPFWGKFRKWKTYKRALPGLNASAVGLVVSAAVSIVLKVIEASPFPKATVCIGLMCAFGSHVVQLPKGTLTLIQAPIVIVVGGLLGLLAHAAEAT
jgi:chromate transporter